MTTVSESLIGLEVVQRGAFLVLFEGLNNAITQMSNYFDTSDQELAAKTGREYVAVPVEQIDLGNFYEGHQPSLINAPMEGFPNIAVMALRVTPNEDDAVLDQATAYRTIVFVEVLVRSENNEDETNKRIHRTVEAVNFCIQNNPTLGGSVSGIEGAPTIDISEVFTRKEQTAYGPEWYWQGARIEYSAAKYAQSAPESGFFRSSFPGYDEIDQT